MNKVTIIYGPVASGKSTKAQQVVNGRNSETFNNYTREADLRRVVNEKPGFTGIPESVAIFDEVRWKDVPRLVALINSNSVLVRKPYTKKAEYYERPEMIILTTDSRIVQDKAFGTGQFIEYIRLGVWVEEANEIPEEAFNSLETRKKITERVDTFREKYRS